MNSETIAFGVPFVGLLLGGGILVSGLFLGGLTLVPVLGGALGMLSIAALALAVARAASDGPSVTLSERESDESRHVRKAK